LSVPAETRSIFITAGTAAFAGFAVMGLFTSVSPSFVATVIGNHNHAVAGALASSIFLASATAQLVARRMAPPRAMAIGCALLVLAMVALAIAVQISSMTGLIAAAVLAGIGQGISFSRGLAAVVERTPLERRAEVSSSYFVIAYVGISLPVVGLGLAAQDLGLRTAGVSFAIAVAIVSAICLAAILVQESTSRPH
jgi:MFS family permease